MSKIRFEFYPGLRIPGGKEPELFTVQERKEAEAKIVSGIDKEMPDLHEVECTVRFDKREQVIETRLFGDEVSAAMRQRFDQMIEKLKNQN